MKKNIIILSLVLYTSISFAQIEGISASRLGTYCAETVAVNSIEFEPAFSFATATKEFNNDGVQQNLFLSPDSTQLFSSFGFRFTYGLFQNFEIGVSLPVDVSTMNIGAKYKLPFHTKTQFAIFAGYNAIIGNKVYVKRNSVHELTSFVVAGFAASYNFSDKLGFDFNAQYHKHSNSTVLGHNQGFSISTDVGYYLFEDISFISGFKYLYKDNDEFNNHYYYLFTINPGISIERSKKFGLSLNVPIDLLGKNEYKTTGFGMALTVLLN